ncbi:hypothetical protein FVEN_g12924 [Fusarium venenatum]|nr:hypothetical protein FVEN_g12924 [Fusarium venenatum]
MVTEAKSVRLSYLRKAHFYELGLHHTDVACSACGYDFNVEDDRSWDISEQIKLDDLDSQMRIISGRDYYDLKLDAMISKRRE